MPAALAVAPVLLLLAGLASSPWWLPARIISLRVWLFTLINGPDGLCVPSPAVNVGTARRLYDHPGARLRSVQGGVGLSDLFWYLLSPGADVHQEHTESGTRLHAAVAGATKALLAVPHAELEALAEDAVAWRLRHWADGGGGGGGGASNGDCEAWRVVRLREWLFPCVARFWFAVCFGPLPGGERGGEGTSHDDAAIAALAASGADVIDALKALKLRDMRTRDAATAVVQREMAARPRCRASVAYAAAVADGVLSPAEAALALQGVIFHTGTVQLTDALTHLALALAQAQRRDADGGGGPSGWDRVAEEAAGGGGGGGDGSGDPSAVAAVDATADAGAPGQGFLRRCMHEALRVWPLFGVAHRITDRDIMVPRHDDAGEDGAPHDAAARGNPPAPPPLVVPAGTVLVFDYTALHRTGSGLVAPGTFDPERWLSIRGRDLPAYMPFGAARNRPCPAQRLCLASVPAFTRALARGVALWSSAEHSRSLPGRGLAVLQPRPAAEGGGKGGGGAGSVQPGRLSARPLALAGLLAWVRAADLADGVRLSLTQLVAGTVLVVQARAAALANRYHTLGVTPRGGPVPAAQR